ncbi:MAG: sulfatase-like hydrolase/transferase [Acidobacteriota bacterium]|nr:sulfatase-like hydrolase/transferase [Acidobacteriota bacterium]
MNHLLPFAPVREDPGGVADHRIAGLPDLRSPEPDGLHRSPQIGHPILILLCLVLATCAPLNASAASGDSAPVPVILISIDTLRADHLGAYGYTKIHTPHIDSFTQGGTRFIRAETQIPLTLPSHTSLFTSTYPFENRVEENGERVPAGVVTLASVLQSYGYKTAAFIGSAFMDRSYGLDQGFDEYDSPFALDITRVTNPLAMSLRRDGALVVRSARQWLDAHRGQPVFVFVHLFDLHFPYTLPAGVANRQGISRYDAQLQYVDQVMGRFQQELMRGGWWQKSLVVVISDHGEGLGDHQETDHGYYIYESTLHVPLIFHWPRTTETRNSKMETGNSKLENGKSKFENRNSNIEIQNPEPRVRNSESGIRNSARVSNFDFRFSPFKERADAPVGLIDVAPTILDYLRIPAPAAFEGHSQLGTLKAEAPGTPHAVYSESLYAHDAFRWAPLRALRMGKYKYIQSPKAELYDLDADPHEHTNLLRKNGAVASELQNELAKMLTRYAPSQRAAATSLSPETLAQLESLGYLAAEPRGKMENSGPDPKDRFAEFQLYQSAFLDFTEGHSAVALPKLLSILRADPQNTLARYHLGECFLQLKKPQDALREWVTVLKLDPQYAPAAEAIGQYWLAKGDYAKARRRFEQVLTLTPDSYTGHFQLAIADEHLGLLPEARQHLEIACKIAPHDEGCARKLKSLTQR